MIIMVIILYCHRTILARVVVVDPHALPAFGCGNSSYREVLGRMQAVIR